MTLHETHRCRDCSVEITIPYAAPSQGLPNDSGPLRDAYQAGFRAGYAKAEDAAAPSTGTLLVPSSYVLHLFEELATWVGDFLSDAADGPWRPESPFTEEGLPRATATIWLTNDAGDQLEIEENTAARLVEALRLSFVSASDRTA